ncbi:carboxylesterase family protein [Xylaria intraflava]|nr:carboxylesterase family protein [Xylaria intraflava]
MRSVYSLAVALPALAVARELPVVDLGYERHRAVSLNETGSYYNFTNIRYGQAPVGDLRWAEPKAPVENGANGSYPSGAPLVDGTEQGGNCAADFPCWFQVQTAFVEAYLAGDPFDFNATYEKIYADGACSQPPPADARPPGETEDCLFLDVFTPTTAFDAKRNSNSSGAPVLVYIFGGGYSGGGKNNFGNFNGSPAGLIDSSRVTDPDGIIYVAVNYRLGALGWMFGSDFESQGGVTNLGLYDQRLALNWVQQNIHLFGGDPNRVTVMGESAGGGSILMQMTAFGTGEKAPFQQAIMQSPAWEPDTSSPEIQNEIFNTFLGLLNVSSLEEAKKLPSSQVIDANYVFLSSAHYGTTYLGPVVSGPFVPDDPKRLLRDGKVDSSVKILTTIGANEGLRFAPGNISTEADFVEFVDLFLSSANQTVRDHVVNVVYPPIFNGSLPWTNQLERAGAFWAELVSTCNANYLHAAMDTPGYANLFGVWPALHQGDIPYVFWNGPQTLSSTNDTVARITQDYITAFTINGNPNNKESPSMSQYDSKSVLGMTAHGFSEVTDPTDNDRCVYWHDAPFH